MAVDHYENFPVASILLPKPLRHPVTVLYRFARSADDLADEGDAPPAVRTAALQAYRDQLAAIAAGEPPATPLFRELAAVIREHQLPIEACDALLDAFMQDVHQSHYQSFDELLDYCRRSADPVGRLMLHLFREASPQNLVQSDHICTALQLINHWQDVAIDWKKPRVYLPADDMTRFGVSDAHLAEGRVDDAFRALMRFQVDRARQWMLDGAPLATALPGRIGWEIRLIVEGGLRVLDKIEAVGYDVFRRRPTLGTWDAPRLLWSAWRRPNRQVAG